MSFGKLAILSTIVLLLGSDISAAGCGEREFEWAEGNWGEVCHWPEGVYSCGTKAQWEEAKKNIDWVLFEDAGALATFKAAYKENESCDTSLGGKGEAVLMLEAMLYAQRHNLNAQCSIELCRSDWWGFQGYHDYLKEKGRLPKID
jgi:hypothetical protein